MGQTSPLATLVAFARSYWKGLTLCTAALAWVLASVTPRFGFVTKLTFGSFLLRTYWPEILVALVLIGASLVLLKRFGMHSVDSVMAGKSIVGRMVRTVRQVTVSDRVYGLIVVAGTIAACIPLLWKQASLMLEAEQTFVATRLMNWFGDDLHRIAARQINDGNYDAAVRTLKVQARELGDLDEGHTAERVASGLADRLEYVEDSRKRTLELMKRAGVVRSDLLLLGTLQAMLPPHALGAESTAVVPGAEAVQAYLDALRRIKTHCDSASADAPPAQDVGMAAAALGLARTPWLLFGPVEDPGQRAKVLCEIVGPLDPAAVDQLHRSAFSVSARSERLDWRMPVSGTAATPGVMVVRSFGRAIDTVAQRSLGITPLEGLLPTMEAGARADRQPTPVLEATVVAVAPQEPTKNMTVNGEAFAPVTLIESSKGKRDAHARVSRRKGGIQLVLCIPSDVTPAFDGYSFDMREDGRLQISETDECTLDGRDFETTRSIDASLLAAITRFIAIVDAGRSVGTPPSARGSLCRVLVANVRHQTPAQVGTAMNLCPIDAAAIGLSLRPPPERR